MTSSSLPLSWPPFFGFFLAGFEFVEPGQHMSPRKRP